MVNVSLIEFPDAVEYPESDGEPMGDNTLQIDVIFAIYGILRYWFRDRGDSVFVAGNHFWYPVKGNPKIRVAPDAMVVFGRPQHHRSSYRQFDEDDVAPQVAFEILSPGNTALEMLDKLRFYDQYGVDEYYVFDPPTGELRGWLRPEGGHLTARTEDDVLLSPLLGLTLVGRPEQLLVLDPDGNEILDHLASRLYNDQAEAEARAAKAETARAEAEAQAAKAEQRPPGRRLKQHGPRSSGYGRSSPGCRAGTGRSGRRRSGDGAGRFEFGDLRLGPTQLGQDLPVVLAERRRGADLDVAGAEVDGEPGEPEGFAVVFEVDEEAPVRQMRVLEEVPVGIYRRRRQPDGLELRRSVLLGAHRGPGSDRRVDPVVFGAAVDDGVQSTVADRPQQPLPVAVVLDRDRHPIVVARAAVHALRRVQRGPVGPTRRVQTGNGCLQQQIATQPEQGLLLRNVDVDRPAGQLVLPQRGHRRERAVQTTDRIGHGQTLLVGARVGVAGGGGKPERTHRGWGPRTPAPRPALGGRIPTGPP